MTEKFVTYEEFGAVGDGVTDDFAAIKRAHDYANENGLPVKAKDGAHYYIHETRIDGVVEAAVIKTDTNWGSAKFTIDDRDLSLFRDSENFGLHRRNIFEIVSDYPMFEITDEAQLSSIVSDGLNRSTSSVDLKLGYPAMIVPFNSKHRVYRRRGYGGFKGADMHEVIVLDKDGKIDESTPVMFDYKHIDRIKVYRLDIKPITVEGGEFTTRACRENMAFEDNGVFRSHDGYLARSINVMRSYTTVKNVKHYVTDELTVKEQIEDGKIVRCGYCYTGFFMSSWANEVTFDGCVMTGRRCYTRPEGGTGGTYDIGADCVNKIIFKNCNQTNFWIKIDEEGNITPAKEGEEGAITSMSSFTYQGVTVKLHWGLGGTNFCKNMEYHDSTISRFDAHAGLYHGKIINCTVNYMAITGNGNFIVENTRWFAEGEHENSNSLIHLRADYGSTWEGTITMKNIKAYIFTTAPSQIFMHRYSNWYYGYIAHYPNISIDNIEYYNIKDFKKLPENYEIYISGASIKNEPALHLENTLNCHPYFADVDEDGDGLVDGTNIPYDDVVERGGIRDDSTFKNLSPIAPPELIRLVNSKNACRVLVYDTANYKDVPNGGFFGKTSFVSDNNTYKGTDYVGRDTETFKFITIE